MKFYIATAFGNKREHRKVTGLLNELGHTVTYDWTSVKPLLTFADAEEIAAKEMNGVLQADVVIVLIPGGPGTHAELGAAIAYKKKILIRNDNLSLTSKPCIFYHHPSVKVFPSIQMVMEEVERMKTIAV